MDKDSIKGLTSQEVVNLPKNLNINKFSISIKQIILRNIVNFFNTLLFTVSVMLVLVNKANEAVFITIIVTLNTGISIYQEIKAKKALDKLNLINPQQVTALRDGVEILINYEDVVLGDTIIVKTGDQIITDGKVLFAENVQVDESILTGESNYISKRLNDQVTSGSFVITGTLYYQTTAVGRDTYSAKLLEKSKEFNKQNTLLQKQINHILFFFTIIMAVLASFTLISDLIQSSNTGQPLNIQNVVINVATVVSALVPIGLVLTTTIAYAAAAVKMYEYKVLIQKVSAVESMSHVEVLCMDKTGTLTTNNIEFVKILTPDEKEPDNFLINRVSVFAQSAKEKNKTVEALKNIEQLIKDKDTTLELVKELPFNSHNKYSAGIFNDNSAIILGAPEIIFSKLNIAKSQAEIVINKYFAEGYRALVVASGSYIDHQSDSLTLNDIQNPQIAAILILKDEIRHEAAQTIKSFQALKIDLKIISGDNQESVATIASAVGLNKITPISGLELEKLSDKQFKDVILKYNVFGRITPEQKEKIISTLQQHKKFVGMIGDGVNDILAIKKADLGIAMNAGAQMTKDVADIILISNSFAPLPLVFRQGEQIYSNIVKVACLFISKSVYTAALIILTGYLSLDFPFLPKQVTLISLLTVGIPPLFIALIPSPIRHIKSFTGTILSYGFSSGLIYTLASILAFLILYVLPGSPDSSSLIVARSGIVTLLVFGGLFGAFLVLLNENITWKNISQNRLNVAILVLLAIGYIKILYTPHITAFFEITKLSALDWLIIVPIFISASTLFYIERKNRIFAKFFK